MSRRVPYEEPLTVKERLSVRYMLKKGDVMAFFDHGLWQWLAWKMPHRLVLWCFIRVCANAGTDVPPDKITYDLAYKRWEGTKNGKKNVIEQDRNDIDCNKKVESLMAERSALLESAELVAEIRNFFGMKQNSPASDVRDALNRALSKDADEHDA